MCITATVQRIYSAAKPECFFVPAFNIPFILSLCLKAISGPAHTGDPLADVQLKESDYRWVTEQITQIAEECAQGRIVSCLEGGYSLQALAASVVAHLRVLMGVNGA
ncbi:MAG: hypothetical protein P8Y42_14485 [Exilibacterium sp.]